MVGLYNRVEEQDIVTFINVREVLFRPRASYTHHFATTRDNIQQVVFSEMVEHGGECHTEVFNVENFFVYPLIDFSPEGVVYLNQPSTSSRAKTVIRVAAFAAGSKMNFDENRVTKHFIDAIKKDLEPHPVNTDANPYAAVWTLPENSVEPSTENRLESCGLNEFLTERNTEDEDTDCTDINLDLFKK